MIKSKNWLLVIALVGMFGLAACENVETTSQEKEPATTEKEKSSEMDQNEGKMEESAENEMKDEDTKPVVTTYKGDFVGIDHAVSGSVEITEEVSFKNFRIDSAPAVEVYLTNDDDVKTGVKLGDLKAESGDQQYAIPNDVTPSGYNRVTIWCDEFKVPLASATLKM